MASPVPAHEANALRYVRVRGFKAARDNLELEIRPLTILAGANSSGKSSALQPLLLMKQTLEAGYDAGALLLTGANARFSAVDEFLWRGSKKGDAAQSFSISLENGAGRRVNIVFRRAPSKGVEIEKVTYVAEEGTEHELRLGMNNDDLWKLLPTRLRTWYEEMQKERKTRLVVERERCFLHIWMLEDGAERKLRYFVSDYTGFAELALRNLLHLPGLRGHPERLYPVTDVGTHFPGTFQNYAASIIAKWGQPDASPEQTQHLRGLGEDMELLGLTWKIQATQLNDTQVEIRVGRLPHAKQAGALDLVNIADVGFGVSQTLPLLVALRTAAPGSIVYVEQPEIHLHPLAQEGLAEILVAAARRGVRVIVETHSDLLILAIRTQVAEGAIAPSDVKLHWFDRDGDGVTRVKSASPDDDGASNSWPQDFGRLRIKAEDRYLRAVEKKHLEKPLDSFE